MITGALILAAGVLIGWVGRTAIKPPPMPAKPPGACSCGHHLGMHFAGKGKCNARDTYTHIRSLRDVPCECQVYDGPEPLPEYFAREIKP